MTSSSPSSGVWHAELAGASYPRRAIAHAPPRASWVGPVDGVGYTAAARGWGHNWCWSTAATGAGQKRLRPLWARTRSRRAARAHLVHLHASLADGARPRVALHLHPPGCNQNEGGAKTALWPPARSVRRPGGRPGRKAPHRAATALPFTCTGRASKRGGHTASPRAPSPDRDICCTQKRSRRHRPGRNAPCRCRKRHLFCAAAYCEAVRRARRGPPPGLVPRGPAAARGRPLWPSRSTQNLNKLRLAGPPAHAFGNEAGHAGAGNPQSISEMFEVLLNVAGV